MDEARKSELCLECGECCKELEAYWPKPPRWEEQRAALRFLETRGVRMLSMKETPRHWVGRIRVRCPHLQADNRCDIYDRRPAVCRGYDGARDPDVDCRWKGEV